MNNPQLELPIDEQQTDEPDSFADWMTWLQTRDQRNSEKDDE